MTRITRALALPTLVGVLLTSAGTRSGWAQSPATPPSKPVDVVAPEPSPKPGGFELERTLPLTQPGLPDSQDFPGYDVKTGHDPALVHPFVWTIPTSPTSGIRTGLSGWTTPALPYDIPQATGGPAIGLSVFWGVPIPPRKEAPAAGGGGPR